MSKKLWFCTTLVSIGLLGCESMPKALALGCNPGICKVEVTVVDCKVSVQPDPLRVPLPRGAKNIHWDIVSKDYVFAANGIVIDKPDREFDAVESKEAGTKFIWHDKHTKKGEYKYSVNVIRTGVNPKVCPTFDPLIANE